MSFMHRRCALALLAACSAFAIASPAGATVLYETGFEGPTFTTGALAGQDGWSEFPAASPAAQIQTTFVASGSQALAVIPAIAADASIPQDGPYKTVATAAPVVRQSADIFLASSTTQSGWQFAALGAGLIGFAGGIDIDSDGTIHAITAAFPTIGTFARDTWNHVGLTLDYSTQTYSIDLNGTTLLSDVAFCGDNGPCAGGPVSGYFNGFFDVFASIEPNDLGALDNYRVETVDSGVPEPATWAMMLAGFGLVGGAVRRSRKVALRYA